MCYYYFQQFIRCHSKALVIILTRATAFNIIPFIPIDPPPPPNKCSPCSSSSCGATID